ncbi:acyltransferase [Neobacillus sp. YIM B06451]|uniref:acyltransferase family protein n=1 Tax=Neobacillus sp. YIM B06451 TaxID=3070994 RepID=UPI00292F105A|nr:acyltransferase [Neobacillus sp. YIM B06451]
MRKRLNLIQFSRALVPLLVVLFHANAFMKVYFQYDFLRLPDVTKSGGVYYFFVLSGFMIYYLYHEEYGNQKIIKHYLSSRFKRIYPIYWILTLLIIPIYFIFPSLGKGYEREIGEIIKSLFLLPSQNKPIIGVAWSLVHTVFFYLIFSLFFLKNKSFSWGVIIIWGLMSVVFSVNLLTSSDYLMNFFFNFNNLLFLSGIVSAYVVTRHRIPYVLSLLFVIIGFLVFPLSWINEQFHFVTISLQITTGLASIILILGLSFIDLQKDITIPKFANYFGNASFSIYLTHYLFMSGFSKILSSNLFLSFNKMALSILLILLSIISGCFVYSFIEKPINQKLRSKNKKVVSHHKIA